ncbi:myosin heavy chain, clone, putative [Entamoeba invadens IP1]|uniref:Myosin heavy chain, clone, putative n=1 Tax=Entamoeba invadens IP1 TaxID=370355 RepID=L7FLF3_ENTIV|nr:myosin heavy chain, clone, putative [Entamoeba invadens IP1]ELP86688.1 myosin heavy chain, clone, putative [Entamoeba invadens IP1]|eukprot:XP_004186034.1 myosin heavy chain, clone, putative [Entamoeba invadens IP1]
MEDQVKALNAQVSLLKFQVSAPASVAQEEEKNMLNARFAEIQAQPDEERQNADTNDLTVQVDQLTDEKKKNKDLEEMDKMINDLNAEVDMAHKQLDTANDDKDGNKAMKQKYQDELKSVRTELDQEKKDHSKTQLIKGKYEKDIAEITVKAETLEKNVQMAEQEYVKTMRDYKTASEELMRTKTVLDEKQNECDKLEDDMSKMKTELEALEQAAKTYKQSKNTYEKKLTELNEQLDKLREVMENENEFGEYKEQAENSIKLLVAQKADLQKELEKERTIKQNSDKETQKLGTKVTDFEAKFTKVAALFALIENKMRNRIGRN